MIPLKQLTSLKSLELDRNQIVDLAPLANLNNLQRLRLEANQIQDLSPLIANFSLDKGDKVSLSTNPLNDQSRNEHIPALQARGVEVFY